MPPPEMKQAKSWQNKMEGPLLGLEELGVLDADMADEIRNIVAEGIADKFEERYRTFPGERKGVQIRRDRVPAKCVLKKSFDAHAKAIREDTLPAPIAMARTYGNMQPPSKPRETRSRQATGPPSRDAAKGQSVLPKGSWYRKPEAAPDTKAPSGKKSSPEKSAAIRNAAPTGQKASSSSSKATSPGKLHKHWQTGLTSNTDQAWLDIYDNPSAVLNKLPSSDGSHKAQVDAAAANQSLPSHVPTEKPPAQSSQNVTAKDTAAGLKGASSAKATATATAFKDDVDDKKDVVATMLDDKSAEGNVDGMATKSEEQSTDASKPTIDFGEDLIWLGD